MPGIPLQQALALQVTGDTVRDGVRQMGKFITGWRFYPAKPQPGIIGTVDVYTIQKLHMVVLMSSVKTVA